MLTEIEEELAENVKRQETASVVQESVVGESDRSKDNCKHGETHELDGLASNGVHCGNSNPVTRDCSSTDKNQVTHSRVVEDLVHAVTFRVANGSENDRVVKTETVESNLDSFVSW